MVFVNTDICNGSGECISVCPNGAVILQNNHAFIDQELCQECEICVDSCPQGAIQRGEPAPAGSKGINIPTATPIEITAVPDESHHTLLRNEVLPAVGSALLWTGREIVPRLANLAIDYLDRRIQSTKPDLKDQNIQIRGGCSSGQRNQGREHRRQKRQKNHR